MKPLTAVKCRVYADDMPESLLSGAGAARVLGYSRQYVHQLATEARAKREQGAATSMTFPEPFGLVDDSAPVWRRTDIEAWGRARSTAAA